LLDDTGDVLERYEYDAYGQLRYLDADFTLKASQSSSYDNPYYFTGRRLDTLDNGDLTLQHNRHRTYDPETGRWLTHDPISYDDGMNLYQYARSRPLVLGDPLGLFGGNAFDSYKPDWRGMAAEALRQAEEVHKDTVYYEKGNTGIKGLFAVLRQMLQEVTVRGGILLSLSDWDASYGYMINSLAIRENPRPLSIVHELVHALDDKRNWYIKPKGGSKISAEALAYGTEYLLEAVVAFKQVEEATTALEAMDAWGDAWYIMQSILENQYVWMGSKKKRKIKPSDIKDVEVKLGLRFKCVELRNDYEEYLREKGICLPTCLPCNLEYRDDPRLRLDPVFGADP